MKSGKQIRIQNQDTGLPFLPLTSIIFIFYFATRIPFIVCPMPAKPSYIGNVKFYDVQ